MKPGPSRSFGAQLKALRDAAGFTQEELATIAGLSVHAVSALERGDRRRPHVETVRALSAALDLTGATRDGLLASARATAPTTAVDQLRDVSLPLALTVLLGREADVQTLRHWLADPAARLITLTGPGGAGKTRLALELARAKAAEGARVLFVGLAAVRDAASVAPQAGRRECRAQLLERRGEPRPADRQPPVAILRDVSEQRRPRRAAQQHARSRLLNRLRPLPARLEAHELALE